MDRDALRSRHGRYDTFIPSVCKLYLVPFRVLLGDDAPAPVIGVPGLFPPVTVNEGAYACPVPAAVIGHLLVPVRVVPLADEVVLPVIGKLRHEPVWQRLLQQVPVDVVPAVQLAAHAVLHIVFVSVPVIAQLLHRPVRVYRPGQELVLVVVVLPPAPVRRRQERVDAQRVIVEDDVLLAVRQGLARHAAVHVVAVVDIRMPVLVRHLPEVALRRIGITDRN